MFAEELKTEFLERVSIILEMNELTKVDKISAIGKVFGEIEKKNKALIKANIPPPLKQQRTLTTYNLFIKEKMTEMADSVIPSKVRFKKASLLWKQYSP